MKKKKQIKELINILEDSKINSLELSSFWGFRKIKLSKGDISISSHERLKDIRKSNTSDPNPIEQSPSHSDREIVDNQNKPIEVRVSLISNFR